MPRLTKLSVTGFSQDTENSCLPTSGKLRSGEDGPDGCGKGWEKLCCSPGWESPSAPLRNQCCPRGVFSRFYWQNWQVLSWERRGGTGFVGDLLLPACWSFPRPFPLTFLLTASPQHIPWKLHPAGSGAALLWALGEAALRDLRAEGVEMAPSIGHEPDPGHKSR